MPEPTERFGWLRKLALTVLIVALVGIALTFVTSVGLAVLAAWRAPDWLTGTTPRWAIVLGLGLHALGLGAMALLLIVAYGLVRVILSNEAAVTEAAGRLGRVESLLQRETEQTARLADLASLSDRARSLIYREREIEAIRETIHHDLMRQDYKTAESLIDAIEQNLGYADEAARLRKEVEASRRATDAEKVDAAIERVQEVIDRRDWARALRGAKRLAEMYPDHEGVAALPKKIEGARTQRKRELLQAYGEAVRKNDVDQSIELLRELDHYLTPQEGAALQESARGVFRAHLQQLGVQFAIRVTDEQWTGAIEVGEEIIREFPNSRMAQEVREKMDMLRTRAQRAEAERQAGE